LVISEVVTAAGQPCQASTDPARESRLRSRPPPRGDRDCGAL